MPVTRSDLFEGRGKCCLKHYRTLNMDIQCSVGLPSPRTTCTASSQQYFRLILVCLEANEKLAIWRREHDGRDPSLITGSSPICSNMSQIFTNKTTSPHLKAATSSIFMAASKHRCKMMKLLSLWVNCSVFAKETLEKLSSSPVCGILHVQEGQNSRSST